MPNHVAPRIGQKTACWNPNVTRSIRVALALAAVFSISFVLITPDPTDDVSGVLQANHAAQAQRLLGVSAWEFAAPVVVSFHFLALSRCSRHLPCFELLDVISVWRC